MPIPDGSVVITPAQMYNMQGETAKKVDDLTSEVRALRDAVNPAFADVRATQSDHETTLRSLVRDVTVLKTQAKALWAGIGLLLIALGVLAGFLSAMHGGS